ncbi:hypothetical protein DQG23_05665 [Paenibacillus contaminans]|uniref:Arsenic metallochaperone ArsD family protein n=1 Tax=Paenibacillus contaminans TaxID=450362 RepID=A0A329MSU3_9BACL|nr:hypothetical protein DQG23_05665 [Paenibacillus contaminans]
MTNPEEKRNSIRFAVAIAKLAAHGFDVYRYNLLSDTSYFEKNPVVNDLLSRDPGCLPITLINGAAAQMHRLPSNEELAAWAEVDLGQLEGKQEIRLENQK